MGMLKRHKKTTAPTKKATEGYRAVRKNQVALAAWYKQTGKMDKFKKEVEYMVRLRENYYKYGVGNLNEVYPQADGSIVYYTPSNGF